MEQIVGILWVSLSIAIVGLFSGNKIIGTGRFLEAKQTTKLEAIMQEWTDEGKTLGRKLICWLEGLKLIKELPWFASMISIPYVFCMVQEGWIHSVWTFGVLQITAFFALAGIFKLVLTPLFNMKAKRLYEKINESHAKSLVERLSEENYLFSKEIRALHAWEANRSIWTEPWSF